MRLKPLDEVERPSSIRTTAANLSRMAASVRHCGADHRSSENRLRQVLFTLWVSTVMVKRVATPSWVVGGHVTFEDYARTLGISAEFARKAIIVHKEFFVSGGNFYGFDTKRQTSVQKMHQVYRVARGVREANEWLQVAATATTEELERLIRAALRDREGFDTKTFTAAMHLQGSDINEYLNFTRDSIMAYGTETVARRIMRAIRYFKAHQLKGRALRAA